MSLFDTLLGQLGGQNLGRVSQAIGGDERATKNAIGAALPVLLGALSKNAQSPQGAEALNKALERDHSPSLLQNLGGANLAQLFGAGGGKSEDGAGILKHLLGGKQQNVEASLAKSTGLDAGSIAKLLPILAPVVMSALSKQKQEKGLGAAQLGSMLQNERANLEQRAPQTKSMLGKLFDQDGDGDFDLGDVTKGLLGKLF